MSWIRFDTKSFLKASLKWDDDIRKLEEDMAAMSDLPSVDNQTGVRSSETSDLTARLALRKLEITAEIEKIKLNKEMLHYAMRSITERERELVNGFFFSDEPKWKVVEEYGLKYGQCSTYVYEERDRVLRKIGDIILSEYYGR